VQLFRALAPYGTLSVYVSLSSVVDQSRSAGMNKKEPGMGLICFGMLAFSKLLVSRMEKKTVSLRSPCPPVALYTPHENIEGSFWFRRRICALLHFLFTLQANLSLLSLISLGSSISWLRTQSSLKIVTFEQSNSNSTLYIIAKRNKG
jgi:hypothetical protein